MISLNNQSGLHIMFLLSGNQDLHFKGKYDFSQNSVHTYPYNLYTVHVSVYVALSYRLSHVMWR